MKSDKALSIRFRFTPFQKRTAIRIAMVSLLLASIASPLSWYVAKENAEDSIVSLAIEESEGLLNYFSALDLGGADARRHALAAAQAISGGLFDIAEIYDSKGSKLAEAMTKEGEAVEAFLPKHGAPDYSLASYESLNLPNGMWVLRVFVPLHLGGKDQDGIRSGFFEGVRVVPLWQRHQIFSSSLIVAILAGLAALLCGFSLFPVVLKLSKENEQKSLEILRAQAALIDGLRKSESELEEKVISRTAELEREQGRTRELLHNILPAKIADELSATGHALPARHDAVTVLFTDFAGFTQAASTMPADRMVAELNEIFAAFDDITTACGIEKIKTIGDAYMAVAGMPDPCPDHAQRCVLAGLQMIAYVNQRNAAAAFKWSLRVGIHSGSVVAGVVGKRKYIYDLWGDTVNIASRMESAGEIGRVNVSAYTFDLIQDHFLCEYRGKVDAKGKGEIDMYFVTALIIGTKAVEAPAALV